MSRTLLQARDYSRSYYGLDAKVFTNTLLNQWINQSQPLIMQDLVKNGIGVDNFIKTANVSYTTKFLSNVARGSSISTITAVGHGLSVGDYVIVQAVSNTGFNGRWKVATVPDADNFTYAQGGQTVISVADTGWVSKGYANLPTDLMNIDDSIIDLSAKFTTTGAASLTVQDVYYKQVAEKTILEGIATDPYSTNANSYEIPTVTQPYYWVGGDITGVKSFHLRPANAGDVNITYRFKPTDLSADSDTLTLPDEYFDMIRIYVGRYVAIKKGDANAEMLAIKEYQQKIDEWGSKFKIGKQVKEVEKTETEIK